MRFRRVRGRPRTLSIHARLFLGFGGALAVCSALMVAIIYVGIRYLPTYDLTTPVDVPSPASTPPHAIGPPPNSPPSTTLQEGRRIDTSGLVRSKEDVWSTVLVVSVSGVLLVLAVGLGAGWILSRRLLAPLHTINRAAAKAGEGDLSYRINAQGPADELGELADTFDTTLGRLEESFAAHQRFAANASHELLTPLATTRAILQVAAVDPSAAELAELVPMLRETNERNIRVVQELLHLAAADQAVPDAEPVDLAEVAARAVHAARTDRTAQPTDVALSFTSDTPDTPDTPDTGAAHRVSGSATLLHQLVVNLVDNARTHNVPGGTVRVRVEAHDGEVVLEVANTGPVVAPDLVDRLFEPFYRASPRVASDRSGHGLGLAIVRSLVHGHHGTVTARALPTGGLLVRVALPRLPRPGE